MLWIIGGPTSVGKSTFIQSPVCSQRTGFPCDANVIWPRTEVDLAAFDDNDGVYHYNVLRPWQTNRAGQPRRKNVAADDGSPSNPFANDPAWRKLVATTVPKRAIVLVASQATLEDRVRHRLINEQTTLTHDREQAYRGDVWLNLIKQMDLVSIYRTWMAELTAQGIPYECLVSDGASYAPLDQALVPLTITGGIQPGEESRDGEAGNA